MRRALAALLLLSGCATMHARPSAVSDGERGWKALLAGDPAAAEAELRKGIDDLEAMGDRYYLSTTSGFLAEALYQQDRLDEAERATEQSESLAGADDISSQFLWRTVRGKIVARRGDVERGEALVREALELIGRAEEPDSAAGVQEDLGGVLTAGGRADEAAAALEMSLTLFRGKGNEVATARVERKLEALTSASADV